MAPEEFPSDLLQIGSFNVVYKNFLGDETLVFIFPFESLVSGLNTVLTFMNYILKLVTNFLDSSHKTW